MSKNKDIEGIKQHEGNLKEFVDKVVPIFSGVSIKKMTSEDSSNP